MFDFNNCNRFKQNAIGVFYPQVFVCVLIKINEHSFVSHNSTAIRLNQSIWKWGIALNSKNQFETFPPLQSRVAIELEKHVQRMRRQQNNNKESDLCKQFIFFSAFFFFSFRCFHIRNNGGKCLVLLLLLLLAVTFELILKDMVLSVFWHSSFYPYSIVKDPFRYICANKNELRDRKKNRQQQWWIKNCIKASNKIKKKSRKQIDGKGE